MTRILLAGAQGQVGWELLRSLASLGEVVAPGRGALDLADPDSIRAQMRALRPGLVVNAAAYTAVDRAQAEEALAARVNAQGPGVLAEEAQRLGAWLVHYSTDYVFDGCGDEPYGEDDATAPLNAYGRTKLEGERAVARATRRHLIFRTSWVYAARGRNFLRTMLRLGREREELSVVDDQLGAPTWARVIAEVTALAAYRLRMQGEGAQAQAGVYHLTCGGSVSWHGFARAIFELSGQGPARLVPIAAADYPAAARRPGNSRLSNARLEAVFGIRPPHWRTALELCLAELLPSEQ